MQQNLNVFAPNLWGHVFRMISNQISGDCEVFFLPFPPVIDPLIVPVVDTNNRTYQICCPILMPQAGCVFSVDQTFERWNLRSFEIPNYGYILPFKTLWSMKWLFEGETSVWNNEGLGSWGTHVSCWFARFRCGLGRRLGWKGGVGVVRQLVSGFCWVKARRNDTADMILAYLYIF